MLTCFCEGEQANPTAIIGERAGVSKPSALDDAFLYNNIYSIGLLIVWLVISWYRSYSSFSPDTFIHFKNFSDP